MASKSELDSRDHRSLSTLTPARSRSVLLFLLASVLVLWLRCGECLRSAQVFSEDGIILSELLSDGWKSLFYPLSGYLVLIPRFIAAFSLSISLTYFPEVSAITAFAFIIFTVCMLAFTPLDINGGKWLGFSLLLIPTYPECYGIGLYTLWWSVPWVYLALFAKCTSARGVYWRSIVVTVAGLSSPAIAAMCPLFLYRWWRSGQRWGCFGVPAICSIICTVLQTTLVLFVTKHFQPQQSSVGTILYTLPLTLGKFLIGNFFPDDINSLIAGFLFVFVLLAMVLSRSDEILWILAAAWLASVVMSAARAAQIGVAARYLFLPHILMYWILIHLFFMDRRNRALAGLMILISVVNLFPVLSRSHVDYKWRTHLASAINFDSYRIPHPGSTHSRISPWYIRMRGDQCREILDRDLFGKPTGNTFSFSADAVSPEDTGVVSAEQSILWEHTSKPHPRLLKNALSENREHMVLATTSQWTGQARLRMRRGDEILYCCGRDTENLKVRILGIEAFVTQPPISGEIVSVKFSNQQLPEEFEVEFVDSGTDAEDWFLLRLND